MEFEDGSILLCKQRGGYGLFLLPDRVNISETELVRILGIVRKWEVNAKQMIAESRFVDRSQQ